MVAGYTESEKQWLEQGKEKKNRTKHEEEGEKSINERASLIILNLRWKGWDPTGSGEMITGGDRGVIS